MSALPFVVDDGGRAAAGYVGQARDCVARAIAIASGRPYREVYDDLAGIEARYAGRAAKKKRSARNGIHTTGAAFRAYMASIGWSWTPTMGIGTGCRVHLASGELPAGRLVVAVSRHYTAVIDGVVHDTHDPSRGGTRCVYGYWSRGRLGVPAVE